MAQPGELLSSPSFVPETLNVANPKRRHVPRVLLIGRDPALLAIRADVVRLAGCCVRSAMPQAVSDVKLEAYSLMIVGHSLSDAETVELAVKARFLSPRTTLLLLLAGKRRPDFIERLFDVTVSSSDGPAALVRSVQQILSGADLL